MIAADRYPAVCWDCSGRIEGVLAADPSVPYYSCGRVGNGPCGIVHTHPREAPNVEPLTLADVDELLELGRLCRRSAAIARAEHRLGLCEVMHCDETAVNGRCMTHWDDRT